MTNEEIQQKLEEEIHLRGFSPHTHEEYMLRAKSLMLYTNRALEELTEQDLRAYLLYLLDVKKLSAASVNGYNSALRFLYGAVLHRHLNFYDIPRHKHVYTYPTVLTMQEVQQIINSADSLRDKTILMTVYGGGLRVSEIVNLKTSDIYASSMRILIHQGKGRRDRFTLLSKTNLDILTKYWHAYKPKHPEHYLFLNRSKNKMTTRAAADIFRKALCKSGVQKTASIHTLRHCFATHLLESGVDLCQIKQLLLLLTQMRTLAKSLKEFETVMATPGVGEILGPRIIAEIGDVRRFHSTSALVSYAGLDAPPFQSGAFMAGKRSISKRGSSSLRKTGYEIMMYLKIAKPSQDNAVYLYMLKKESEGKPLRVAKIAALNKFLHIHFARVKEIYN